MSLETHRFCNNDSTSNQDYSYLSYRFYNSKITIVRESRFTHSNYLTKEQQAINLRDKKYNGYMSPATRRKVIKTLDTWERAVYVNNLLNNFEAKAKLRKIVFLTLTLSGKQIKSDYEHKRELLMPFIQLLKRSTNMKYYFWKAEAQQNGNIHFHLLIDTFIDKILVQKLWNSMQEKFGYISEFESNHGHRNPPSTEIHLPEMGSTAINYLACYISKKEENRKITGRIWGMSDQLRVLKPPTFYQEYSITNDIQSLIEKGYAKWQNYEETYWLQLKDSHVLLHETEFISVRLKQYYKSIYDHLYNDVFLLPNLKNEYKLLDLEKLMYRPKPIQLSIQY